MILDSSAVVAIIAREPEYEALITRIATADRVAIGAATLLETGIVLSARTGQDARGILARFLRESGVDVLPFTDAHASVAMDAWLRFGKGRHPAALNFGDCQAYSTAIIAGEPLLCVGQDFPQTDCPIA
jgi:ribonuclease VapC